MSEAIRARLDAKPTITAVGDGLAVDRPTAIRALRAVLDLADRWDEFPGSAHGLKMGQMTNGCAAYWIRDAIAEALGVDL